MGLDTFKHGWMEYKQQPVLPASLAYVLLYFNVVLAPGGLMTAFLTQKGDFLAPTSATELDLMQKPQVSAMEHLESSF